MTQTPTDPEKPSPFKLNPARITLLIFGVLALLIIISSLNGSLSNYQTLKEAADPGLSPATTATPAKTP